MAFFDNFSKKVQDVAFVATEKAQQVAAVAGEKANAVADKAKTEYEMASERRSMDKNYRAIGEWYVSTLEGDAPEAVADIVAAIKASQEKLAAYEAAKAEALKAETAAEETRRRLEREGVTDEATINAAIKQAVADARSGKKASIWGPGLIAVCVTWFGLGAFQSATGISIIAFATESNMKQYTGFVFACFSISSLMGALVYGAKNWSIALWKRFYFCLAVVNIGISTFLFAKHLWVIMIIYLIIGVCQAPTWINGNQLMLHLVPPSRLTEGMAWMGAMNSIGSSAGSAIAGQFIDRMGSHGGFMVVTTLALVSLVIALIGFKQIKGSTEQPTLTEVSV